LPGRSKFSIVLNHNGRTDFPPGDTVVTGTFCWHAPAGTSSVRVEYKIDAHNVQCDLRQKSAAIPPCTNTCTSSPDYSDVTVDNAFYADIYYFGSAGIVSGYADG